MASDRSIAKLALFFAVMACVIGGLAIMQNSGEVDVYGKLKSMAGEAKKVLLEAKEKAEKKTGNGEEGENGEGGGLDIFEEGTPSAFEGDEKPEEDRGSAGSSGEGSSENPDQGPSVTTLQRIKDQIDKFEGMIRSEDGQKPEAIDNIKQELGKFRDYTAERTGPTMEKITEGLTEAWERVGDDSTEAAEKMQELSNTLVKQLKEKAKEAEAKLPKGDGEGE